MAITYVSEIPNPVVRPGMGPGVLYNRDPTRPLFIGTSGSIVAGNQNTGSILDPLTSLYVAGDADIWLAAPVGTKADNAIPVDYIHFGRSQHYTSPALLSQPLTDLGTGIGTANDNLDQIIQALENLSPGGGGGPSCLCWKPYGSIGYWKNWSGDYQTSISNTWTTALDLPWINPTAGTPNLMMLLQAGGSLNTGTATTGGWIQTRIDWGGTGSNYLQVGFMPVPSGINPSIGAATSPDCMLSTYTFMTLGTTAHPVRFQIRTSGTAGLSFYLTFAQALIFEVPPIVWTQLT